MKFATVLRNSADELPDAAELFTLYKHLKKSLKRIPCGEGFQDDTSLVGELASGVGEAGSGDDELTGLGQPSSGPEVEVASREAALPAAERASLDESEQAFVAELTQDVDQLNEQYMEKEELNVIRFDALKNELQGATAPGKLLSVHRALVDFHGELLLVLHWSVLAYTGLVKILKKHHKRTGVLLRAPHLTNMLGQPFCSVEVTVGMIREVEGLVRSLASQLGAGASQQISGPARASLVAADAEGEGPGLAILESESSGSLEAPDRAAKRARPGAPGDGGAPGEAAGRAEERAAPHPEEAGPAAAEGDSSVLRRTRAALGLWRQLQLTASTPSTVLPGDCPGQSGATTQVGSVGFTVSAPQNALTDSSSG